jgi:hypothetical protein
MEARSQYPGFLEKAEIETCGKTTGDQDQFKKKMPQKAPGALGPPPVARGSVFSGGWYCEPTARNNAWAALRRGGKGLII